MTAGDLHHEPCLSEGPWPSRKSVYCTLQQAPACEVRPIRGDWSRPRVSFADADEAPRRDEHCQAVDELAASESVYRTAGTTTAPFDCYSGLVFDTPLQLDKGDLKPIAWEDGRPKARH